MNEILQLSQLLVFDDSNATCLPKRIYAASQGLVDDLQAHVASLYAKIIPEDLYEVMLLAEESFRTVKPLHVEYRIQNTNSSESWLKADFIPEMQDGSALEWHGFITEATKSKYVEDVLEHLYKALDSLADPVFVKDRQHRWIFLNDACCQMIGFPREALIGKTEFDFFPEQEAKVFWEKDEAVFSSGQESISEETLTDSKGSKQTILSKKTRYTDSHWQHFIVGIISNITARKQAEVEKQKFLTILEESVDFVGSVDMQGHLQYRNRAALRMIGLPDDTDISAMNFTEMYPTSALELLQEVIIPTALAQGAWRGETALLHRDGREIPVSQLVVVHKGADGQPEFISTVMQDITERKKIEALLASSERGFRAMIENAPDGIVRYDRNLRILYVNPAAEIALGRSASVLIGNRTDELFFSPVAYEFQRVLQRVLETGQADEYLMISNLDGLGRPLYDSIRVAPEISEDGSVQGLISIGRDISQLRRAEMELIKREQEFRVLVENSPDTINRYDHHCRRIYANPRMQIDSGVPLDELLNKTPEEFPGGDQAHAYQQKICKVINTGIAGQFELTWPTPSGKEMCSHIHLTPEFDAAGNVMSVLAVGRDITEIDRYRKQIQHLVYYDPLTNLSNRSRLNDLVSQVFDDPMHHGKQFGLIVMDLDRFKEINDALGHSFGDKVLCEAARRLQSCVRSNDILARLGGDEFAIFQPEIDNTLDLDTIACQIILAFNRPFMIDGRELFITTSIGIAIYPNHSHDVESLFRHADSAMYHAKKFGRNNYQFYSASLSEKAAERMSMESDLRKALERNELELYYQPQVALATGEIIGAEALLRWNHGQQGMIAPDKFIPIAEEAGLIVDIGEWVLHSSCQAAVAWNAGRATPLCIAVNLSTRQFIRNDLVATVQRIMKETACEPSWIKLEITESLLLEDSAAIGTMLDAFNGMGHAISIDDFGTGYSALGYLNRFPVAQIKIDRSFVQGIPNNHEKTELVKVMISIAQVLKMELVAEGVETQEQADCLLANSCAIVQGYLFGKPMPYAAFEALIL